MGKTQYYTATTLDGYIADEHHSLDWLMQLGDPEETSYPAFIAEVGAIAMGASTYEWILKHLVAAGENEGAAWPYTQPVWVFTHRDLSAVDGADIHFVQGDVAPVHSAMTEAAGEKNLWIAGGGDLVGQFYDAGLLDELIVQVCPVTLGAGMPLLPRRIATPPLQLQSAETYGPFVELRYTVPTL